MIFLHPIHYEDKVLFQGTSYAKISPETMDKMLAESLAKSHDGKYFELFAVMDGNACVGVVSLYETAPETISCGPEIKPQYRQQGYGYLAVKTALERASLLGYPKALAQIRQDNAASIALHKKLGFTLCRSYTNKNDAPVFDYIKAL